MSEQRDSIVRRVVHALDDEQHPEEIVRSYFDADREVVLAATRETLAATREDVSEERLAAVVDKELVDALRFPERASAGMLPKLYLHRRAVGIASTLAALGATLLYLFA